MIQAVITGDIVGSTRINDPKRLIRSMEYLFNELDAHGCIVPGMWEIFKGDSFQLVADADRALEVSLLLRSGFRGMIYTLGNPLIADEMLQVPADARLGVGIGSVEHLEENLSRAYGEAFVLSGKQLQRLSEEKLCINVGVSDDDLARQLEMMCRLADVIIREWTANSAQAVYRMMLTGGTQGEVASFIGITQPSVQSRLQSAHFDEIRDLLSYFSDQIGKFVALYTEEEKEAEEIGKQPGGDRSKGEQTI